MAQDIKILDSATLRREVGVVVGTRPGIVMFAPIIHELRRRSVPHFTIHTGQHYSPNMDEQFFSDLDLPRSDYRLEGVAERKTHGGQTAAMLEGIEAILLQRQPCLLLVGGDANSNLAGALAARKLRISVGHVEAGERSYDRTMPEEHNRVMIDHISDYLFVTGNKARENLLKEAIQGEIQIVGNPIVDASMQHFPLARERSDVLARFGLTPGRYALMTSHREENVDVKARLQSALEGVSRASVANDIPTLFLAHPRTGKRLAEFGLQAWAEALPGLTIEPAVGYLDFLNLVGHARMVFTDSGGVQQEACIHHVPCITLRDNTEWVETLAIGANRLSGCDPDRILRASQEALTAEPAWGCPFGDGTAAQAIAEKCHAILAGQGPTQATAATP